ncbi:sialidase family protein [Clostridium sp.]|uniref:WD40/YVTN/BNR-like repeat-containing protein n=1 Tax=Clostridium sp. TaxID=1506 RepID=UPI002FC74D91
MDHNKSSMKNKSKLWVITISSIVIIAAVFFSFYKYQEKKLQLPVGFSVESETKDITLVGTKWLEAYLQQYEGKYVPRSKKVLGYSIDGVYAKDANVIQIDFSIVPKLLNEKTSSFWNGAIMENKINCQWVLCFKEEESSEGSLRYTLSKLQSPAGYDLEKYQTSGEKEKDEYKQQYEAEIPYEVQQYTYKINNKICYVSYDKGSNWKEVPIDLDTLVAVGDGREYFNKLQEGSCVISPEKTAFIYGGTREIPLNIIYSDDSGSTWKTSEISKVIDSARVKFCSFPTDKIGFVVATSGRAMTQEGQLIYKTIDGGATWSEVGPGPSTKLLISARFIEENIGFMSYKRIEGAESSFYRTEDGGKTFQPVNLPVVKQEWMGQTFEPFIQTETPFMENGELYLLVGQGESGDFNGGNVMGKFKSIDKGKTWTFVELYEPPSKEIG